MHIDLKELLAAYGESQLRARLLSERITELEAEIARLRDKRSRPAVKEVK